MGKIITITRKNFKLILRSKASAIIMLLGPVILMLVVGFAFNFEGEERINIGYFEKEENNLTNEFIGQLDSAQYSLQEIERVEECNELIGQGHLHICIIFPEDFRIEEGRVNTIDFLVDNSQVNIFMSAVTSIERRFNEKARELTTGMTQDLLERLDYTTEELTNKTKIVNKLKEKNYQITSKIREVEDEVSKIDVSFEPEEVGLEEFDGFESTFSDITFHAERAIDDFEDVFDDIEDEVSKIKNITEEEKEEIDSIIDDARNDLNHFDRQIINEAHVSRDSFNELIEDINEKIENIEDRFEGSKETKDSSLGYVDELKDLTSESLGKIKAIEDTFNSIVVHLDETEITDVTSIVSPVEKNVKPILTHEGQLNFYFPYLLILITMFVGTLLASNLVYMEKASRAYFRNFVTPIKDSTFLMGTYLTTLIMIIIQLTFVFLVFNLYFEREIADNFALTSLVLFTSASIFIFIGMLLGNIFNSNESNMLAAISVSSIMLFVSDLIYPLERMPETVASLAAVYNPFYVASDLIRMTMIHKVDFYGIQQELSILMITAVVLLVLVFLMHKLIKKLFILKFSGYVARKNQLKETKKENQIRIHENIKKPKEPFITIDKKELRFLNDIIDFLENISKEEFKRYVNNEKNLIAEWVSKAIEDEELASKLYKTKRKGKTLRLLKKEEKFFKKFDEKKTKTQDKK